MRKLAKIIRGETNMVTETTRRAFLKHSAGFAGAMLASQLPLACAAERETILVNHVGFTPTAAKFCLLRGRTPVELTVLDRSTGQVAFRGTMRPVNGDLGQYLIGDFSQLQQLGTFAISSGGAMSGDFAIAADIYRAALSKCVSYFARQRCGDSKTGYHAPCHVDDGRRLDNGQLQDVSGGWHDACDLRKWVNATLYGMTGLYRVLDVMGPNWQRERILDELRWGNQYFRKMQEPAGYVMDYCGGDDSNHWTDNRRGTQDDRPIHVDPCEFPSQFHFLAAQAAMVRHLRQDDPTYSRCCKDAALKCLQWCLHKEPPRLTLSLSMAILAAIEMHRALGGEEYRTLAATYVSRLVELQATGAENALSAASGFFRAEPNNPEPYRAIMHGNLPLLALCHAIEHLPDHPDAPGWRERLGLHGEYLQAMSERSAFGIIPFGLYLDHEAGGSRHIGSYSYRWFMKPRDEHAAAGTWYVGSNAHVGANGIGLCKAARILKLPRLFALAQRQLDWILGANPFDASTMTGVGRNQPRLFLADEFVPPTPLIPGGVMNGVAGSASDEPVLNPGSYNTCEYWTPMIAYTMWLMAELQAGL